jgi:hypothetical protein
MPNNKLKYKTNEQFTLTAQVTKYKNVPPRYADFSTNVCFCQNVTNLLNPGLG